MKRILKFIVIFVFLLAVTDVAVCAQDSDFYSNSIESVIDSVDDDTKELLSDFGLSEYTYDELYNISFSDIQNLLLSVFKGSLKIPVSCAVSAIGIALVSAIGSVYITKSGSMAEYFEMITVVFISLLIFSKIIGCISRTVTSIESLGVFMKILVPVLAVMASFSGSPALAVSYNAVTVYTAEVITAVCRDILTPLLVIFACIAVCLSLNSVVKADSVLGMFKKFINMILGLAGTVFTGVVAIKDILSAGADKVSVKGIKFLLGSSVPVVGSVLSEGLSSIIASVSLMKNTFGIIGIILIIVLVLPVACELTVWILFLSFTAYCCEMFGQSRTASVISSLKFTVSMLLSVLLFTVYILIVSTGMIILIGNK